MGGCKYPGAKGGLGNRGGSGGEPGSGGEGGTRVSHVIHDGVRGRPEETMTTCDRLPSRTMAHSVAECDANSAPYTATGAEMGFGPKCSRTIAPGR